jgi:hypothetical protein
MQGRPFALLGVNSDKKDRVKEALKRENITWRSWWDGGSTGGPIARYYGVRGWPTIYILDHRGIIRFIGLRGEPMTQAVEMLVAEAETADEQEANEFPIVGGMAPQLREWTDKSGQYKVIAEFVQFKNGEAHLKKENNDVVQVSMTTLCDDDQEFIRNELKARRGTQ